ncbi:MAG TPA: helix-turn-helix domain-containing protein [Blastocatellia bacterium]|nr:helix-turn-helix domain-containing protein [Blastocatellia bacterium]
METAPALNGLPALKEFDVTESAQSAKCPLTAALTAIGGKWSLICLYWLDLEKRRFNELRRLMPDISHKVLTETLRGLEREGLICRTVYPEVPPRVEYYISPHGESVRPIIQIVRTWGHEHLDYLECKRLEDESNRSATPSA